MLFGVPYRKSLTTLFPRFLKVMASYHENDIRTYMKDAFGYEGEIAESVEQMVELFDGLGIDMYFDGELDEGRIGSVPADTILKPEEIVSIMKASMR